LKKLTLEDQRILHYTLSPFHKPTLVVSPGETVVVETEDAFSGQIRKPGDRRDTEKIPWANPQCGPIYVEGVGKGDALVVEILKIEPTIGQGATRIPALGFYPGLATLPLSKMLGVELPHGTRICPIRNEKVHFNEKLALPYEPMVGTIGTAPEIEAVTSYLPGPHGGNMDFPDVRPGAKVYLPSKVPGALLYIGDAHAAQGDAEISGTAIEMPAEITIKIDLVKGKSLRWPRIELPDCIMTTSVTGAGRTLEDATRSAFFEMILWLEEEYGMDRWDAYELCTQVARVRMGNIWSIATKFPKRYLPT
jgi:amidase